MSKLLKGTRLHLGLTQWELSRLCGIPQGTIANYELGRTTPRPKAINRMLAAMERVEQLSI